MEAEPGLMSVTYTYPLKGRVIQQDPDALTRCDHVEQIVAVHVDDRPAAPIMMITTNGVETIVP